MQDSPYLKPCRLGDVIAAIQVLAYYKFYRLDVKEWATRIAGDDANAANLEEVFRDHPEFFQVTSVEGRTRAALVARRSFTRSYDVDVRFDIETDKAKARQDDPQSWARLSRRPLTPKETAVLIRTAVDLHSRAVEQQRAARWWVPLAGAAIGLLGGVAATLVGISFGPGP